MKKPRCLFIALLMLGVTGCSKENTEPGSLPPSTPFTVNGTTYNSQGVDYFDYGGGYVEYTDTAISISGSRKISVVMAMSLGGIPTTGSYSLWTDSLSIVSGNSIEFIFTESTLSNQILYTHRIVSPGFGNVHVQNMDQKVSFSIGAQNLSGLAYDTVTGSSDGVFFHSSLTPVTISQN